MHIHVADALKTLDQTQFGKWTAYLQLKGSIYEAYVKNILCISVIIYNVISGILLLWQRVTGTGEMWSLCSCPAAQQIL